MAKDANKKPKAREEEDADKLEEEASEPSEEDGEDGEDEEEGDEEADEDDEDDEDEDGADDEDEEADGADEDEEADGADDEDEEADGADDEDEEDEEPVAKAGGASRPTEKAGTAAAVRARPMPRRRRKRGNPTRNIILFVALVGGLAFAFAMLGNTRSGGGGPSPSPKWKEGQTVSAEITLVTTDYQNLACAMEGEIDGRYCAFAERNKASGKPSDPRQADKLLQPYTTVDRVQFMASGLWMTPELKAKLDKENFDRPSPRFSVKCKFHVEGRTKDAYVQWKRSEGWHPASGWYTGYVEDCHIAK